MSITVIHNYGGFPEEPYELQSLRDAAAELEVELDIIDVTNPEPSAEEIDQLGDVVIYRSSSLQNRDERIAWMKAAMKQRILLNDYLVKDTEIRLKSYQQAEIRRHTSLNTIDTHKFNSQSELLAHIEAGKLSWPLIQKPNGGIKGKDVALAKSIEDIVPDETIKRFIFQPFIRNTGDYRVLLVGGEVMGIMKRVAAPGQIVNNISQGGQGHYIKDPELVRTLTKMAEEAIQVFPLRMAGLDIIQSEDDGKFYFLEINLSPGWQGFEEAAGVGVAHRIISMCQSLENGTFVFPTHGHS